MGNVRPHDHREPVTLGRRTVARGAAWSVPVVLASAPAAYAACSGPLKWDARLRFYPGACTSTNCTIQFDLCNAGTGACTASVPAGTQYKITIKNNGSGGDSVNKSTGGGYSIISRSTSGGTTPPANGGSGTIAAGETWTYVVATTPALSGTECTQFAFTNFQRNRNYEITISLVGADGNAANNTLTWTGPMVPMTDPIYSPWP